MATSFYNYRDLYNEAVKFYHLEQYVLALEKFQTCLFFLNESTMREEEYVTSTQSYIQKIEFLLKETPESHLLPHPSSKNENSGSQASNVNSIEKLNMLADHYYKKGNFKLAISTYEELAKLILKTEPDNAILLADTYWSQAMAYKGLHETQNGTDLDKNTNPLQQVKRLVTLARGTYRSRKDIQACDTYLSNLASELATAQFDEAIDYVRLGFTQSSPLKCYQHALECVENALNSFKEVSYPSKLDTQINGWCIKLENELKRKCHRAPAMHLTIASKKPSSKSMLYGNQGQKFDEKPAKQRNKLKQ